MGRSNRLRFYVSIATCSMLCGLADTMIEMLVYVMLAILILSLVVDLDV
jgi:hypothetical protein